MYRMSVENQYIIEKTGATQHLLICVRGNIVRRRISSGKCIFRIESNNNKAVYIS